VLLLQSARIIGTLPTDTEATEVAQRLRELRTVFYLLRGWIIIT
jgi:hypothetical protein